MSKKRKLKETIDDYYKPEKDEPPKKKRKRTPKKKADKRGYDSHLFTDDNPKTTGIVL